MIDPNVVRYVATRGGMMRHQRKIQVAGDAPALFSMRDLPLLRQGTTYDPLATAENLWLSIKVYANGGENALHAHAGEDHAFIVLQGEAKFTFGDGTGHRVCKLEGVMIPKHVLYKFEADERENLVLLRVGGGARTVPGLDDLTPFGTPRDVVQQTSFVDGTKKIGDAPRNGETSKTRIFAENEYFAPSE